MTIHQFKERKPTLLFFLHFNGSKKLVKELKAVAQTIAAFLPNQKLYMSFAYLNQIEIKKEKKKKQLKYLVTSVLRIAVLTLITAL